MATTPALGAIGLALFAATATAADPLTAAAALGLPLPEEVDLSAWGRYGVQATFGREAGVRVQAEALRFGGNQALVLEAAVTTPFTRYSYYDVLSVGGGLRFQHLIPLGERYALGIAPGVRAGALLERYESVAYANALVAPYNQSERRSTGFLSPDLNIFLRGRTPSGWYIWEAGIGAGTDLYYYQYGTLSQQSAYGYLGFRF